MDIKALRKGMREIQTYRYPYRLEYNTGFCDAVELCNKLIEKEIRKQQRAKRAYFKKTSSIHDIVV